MPGARAWPQAVPDQAGHPALAQKLLIHGRQAPELTGLLPQDRLRALAAPGERCAGALVCGY